MKTNQSLSPTILLQLGVGLCFLAHGILALTAKASFVTLLGSFGLAPETAVSLLKIIGIQDVFLGFMILFRPKKWMLIWGTIWVGATILAWGYHGDNIMDLLRRSTYFFAPLALLNLRFAKDPSEQHSPQSNDLIMDPSIKKIFPHHQQKAIESLDLSMIIKKIMDPFDGEGWSREQCEEVAQEYRRYLALNLLYPEATIVPNLAVDTMWHYHILDTQAYCNDCQAIFGHILHHYPYFGMKESSTAEKKQFVNAFEETKKLYQHTFNTSMDGPDYLKSFNRKVS